VSADRPTVKPSTVTAALRSIGITQGSVVLVHPDAIVAAQFGEMPLEQRLDLLVEAIDVAIGAEGTLVMPAFSYSFTKGEVFDSLNSPCKVGMVAERFRKQPRVCRTQDPIFSFSCRGPRAEELCSIPAKECFGTPSTFATLHDMNAHIVNLGCSMSSGGTFAHYVETSHGVDYRYRKEFSGTTIRPDGQTRRCSVVYNVRDLARRSEADLRRLELRLEQAGRLRSVEVGRALILGVTANDFFDTAWEMLDEDPVSLIAEGSRA
jgi:aminoglycoside 3-N-acetyltransferase